MKSKLFLIAALVPLFILSGCKETDNPQPAKQSEGLTGEQVRKAMGGTKLPKFMEAPKPNSPAENAKP